MCNWTWKDPKPNSIWFLKGKHFFHLSLIGINRAVAVMNNTVFTQFLTPNKQKTPEDEAIMTILC